MMVVDKKNEIIKAILDRACPFILAGAFQSR
jgi:hypothetical protein